MPLWLRWCTAARRSLVVVGADGPTRRNLRGGAPPGWAGSWSTRRAGPPASGTLPGRPSCLTTLASG
eukprot:8974090-Alexandrium_andersonii.AAC.1